MGGTIEVPSTVGEGTTSSAHTDEGIRKLALDAGMDAYLPKPFTLVQLFEVLHSVDWGRGH
jgi:CheY-like chemotaxis protein